MNGKEADSYVINAEHLVFCKNHLPGKEPEKDCMDEYIKSIKKNKPSFAKPKIENHHYFPERINVTFAQVLDKKKY